MVETRPSERTLELVFYCGSTLLESPCWDSRRKLVYCVSIDQCLIYRINPDNGEVQSYQTEGPVGCVVIEESGTLLSAEKGGIFRIDPETKTRTFLAQPEKDPSMRYNDGKLDLNGRFLVGTKGDREERPGRGQLFSYDGKKWKTIIENTSISNGIGFDKNGQILYFIDTPTGKVAKYKYDSKSGSASFERYIIEINGDGLPDGMCIDPDGMIWVAEWGGRRVCRWDPETGTKLDEVKLPCSMVTSCCLGGRFHEHLYITTAKNSDSPEPLAGSLFRIKIGSEKNE